MDKRLDYYYVHTRQKMSLFKNCSLKMVSDRVRPASITQTHILSSALRRGLDGDRM